MFSKAQGGTDRRLARYDHLIVHVTATRPSTDTSTRDVDKMHKDEGWSGCGYHAVIRRDGTWEDHDGGFPARPIGRSGAHVGTCGRGWNGRSFGVSMAGGVREDNSDKPENNMTDAQFATLREGIEAFLRLHPNPQAVKIMGHRDLIRQTNASPKKACPCFDVIPWWGGVEDEDDEDVGPDTSVLNLGATWTIASGETLSKVASVSGLSLGQILRLNPSITNPNQISVGQEIRLS